MRRVTGLPFHFLENSLNPDVQTLPHSGALPGAAERNRVLRNTYWLLSLSMIPTVLGAWFGLSSGISAALTPGVGLIVFLVGAFGFMFLIEKNKNSAAGVPLLLAFTFFMGVMLSRMLGVVLGMSNGTGIVMNAFLTTGAAFFGMATLSTVIKRDLSAMGKWLTIGAIIVIVAMLANFFIQSGPLMLALSVMCAGIFTAFILYDLKRVRDGYEDNYISATLGIYLSLYNVFQSMLAIFGLAGGSDD